MLPQSRYQDATLLLAFKYDSKLVVTKRLLQTVQLCAGGSFKKVVLNLRGNFNVGLFISIKTVFEPHASPSGVLVLDGFAMIILCKRNFHTGSSQIWRGNKDI